MKRLLASGALVALLGTTALADVKVTGTTEFYYKSVDSKIASQNGDSFGNEDNEIKFTFSNKADSGLEYGYVVEMTTVADSDAKIDESSIYIKGSAGKLVLGGNDNVTANFGIGEHDIMDNETGGTYTDATIRTNAGERTYGSDSDKVSYFTPKFGGFAAGVSYMDSGATGTSDSTAVGASFTTGNIKIGYTMNTQEVSGADDKEGSNLGVKIGLGKATIIGAMSKVEEADEDIDTIGLGASYALTPETTIAFSTMESEDSLDVSGTEKENLKQNMVELKHNIAPGLDGYVNYTTYDYKNGGEASTDDDGSVLRLTIAAKF